MKLNKNKCSVLNITGRCKMREQRNYSINNDELANVTSLKYLGIYLSSDLKWMEHVKYSVNKANRALGFVKRNLSKCSREVRLKSYKSLVRPHVEYACSVWDPHQANFIGLVEKVQRRAVRYICSAYSSDDSVTELISELKLSNLATRRRNHRLSLMFKLDQELTLMEKPNNLQLKLEQRRNDNGRSYQHYKGKSDYYLQSFFPRTVREWNALTPEIAMSSSLSAFKTAIKSLH